MNKNRIRTELMKLKYQPLYDLPDYYYNGKFVK